MLHSLAIYVDSTSTTVCLREWGSTSRIFIDDGIQALIPNAIGKDGSWGTKALQSNFGIQHALGVPGFDGWNDESLEVFLGALNRHIYEFLGRMVPTRAHGFETVLAADSLISEKLQVLVERAGFQCDRIVEPIDALLWHSLNQNDLKGGAAGIWTIVLSTDNSCTVQSHIIEKYRGQNAIVQSSSLKPVMSVSESRWRMRLTQEALTRIPDQPKAKTYGAANQDLLSMIAKMRRVRPHDPIEWKGRLAGAFFSSYVLTVEGCMSWPELQGLHELDLAVEITLKELGSTKPDVLIGGGTGFRWPFIEKSLSRYGKFLTYASPEYTVAYGATENSLSWDKSTGWGTTTMPMKIFDLPQEITSTKLDNPAPPWKRGLDALEEEDNTRP